MSEFDLIGNEKKDIKKGKFKTLKKEWAQSNKRLNDLSLNIKNFDQECKGEMLSDLMYKATFIDKSTE